jgi:hypothetical protein
MLLTSAKALLFAVADNWMKLFNSLLQRSGVFRLIVPGVARLVAGSINSTNMAPKSRRSLWHGFFAFIILSPTFAVAI